MDKHLAITITTATLVKAFLVSAGVWLMFELQQLLFILLTAIILASALEPGIQYAHKKGMSRILSVLSLYASFLVVLGLVCAYAVPILLKEISEFTATLPTHFSVFMQSDAMLGFARVMAVEVPASFTVADIFEGARSMFNFSSAYTSVANAAGNFFSGFFSFFLVIVFSLYFSILETSVDDFLSIVVPPVHREYALSLWKRSQKKIGEWMQGQLMLALIIGVCVYIGLVVLAVPHALVLALIAGLFELIPVFGPMLAAIPAILLGFATGGVWLGALVSGFYLIIQQIENHILYPVVVKNIVGVPPLLVIISIIIGGQLAGFFGVLLAVPCVAVLHELSKDLHKE